MGLKFGKLPRKLEELAALHSCRLICASVSLDHDPVTARKDSSADLCAEKESFGCRLETIVPRGDRPAD